MTTTITDARERATKGRASFGRLNRQNVKIGTFLVEKHLYWNVPERQRESIWPRWKQQLLIDTLLRGPEFMELTPLVFNQVRKERDNGRSELVYSVEDGLQRLSTIYAFLNGELKTFNIDEYYKHVLVKGLEPLPFNKTYMALPDDVRQRFLFYALPVLVTEDASVEIAGERYRRRNLSTPHTTGEDYRSYHPTRATLLAEEIGAHPLWHTMFADKKRKDRRYRFEMSLYLIYMQLHGTNVQLQKNALRATAAGRDDEQLTEAVKQEMLTHLDAIAHLFQGAQITAKTDAIILWQALAYLRRASLDPLASQQGCLKSWFEQAKHVKIHGINQGNLSIFSTMTSRDMQVKFWAVQKKVLLDQEGLVFCNTSTWKTVRDGQEQAPALQRARIDPESSLVITEHDRNRNTTEALPTTGV